MIETLAELPDETLTRRLLEIRKRERRLLVEFLGYLAELDRRKAVVVQGYPSLFSFCTDFLGLSQASPFRRTTAARLLARFPLVAEYLADGRSAARLEPIAPERHVLRVTVGPDFVADLEAVRQALSHKLPAGGLEEVLHECLRVTLAQVERRRFGVGRKSSANACEPHPAVPRPQPVRGRAGLRSGTHRPQGRVPPCSSQGGWLAHHPGPFRVAVIVVVVNRDQGHVHCDGELNGGSSAAWTSHRPGYRRTKPIALTSSRAA